MDDAQRVFDRLENRWSVVSWTALIHGYAQNGDGELALELFQFLTRLGRCQPNSRTIVAALKACAEIASKEEGGLIQDKLLKLRSVEVGFALHAEAARMGCDSECFVQNSLVDMYAKCGSMEDASRVFWRMKRRDLVSWNAIILGYAQNGSSDKALELFEMTETRDHLTPDGATFVAALQACSNIPAEDQARGLKRGMEIHARIGKLGFESDVLVSNTLIDMYAKCGSLSSARRVFERMKNRDVVSWNAMVSGYAQAGEAEMALELFRRLLEDGSFLPDAVTFIAALKACGSLGALAAGKEIHAEIGGDLLQRKQQLATCLIDFYGKCGSMHDAVGVFEALAMKNSVAWNSLLAGFTKQGSADRVMELFEKMMQEKARPNGITFLLILTALSHAGLVDKAKEVFELMSSSKFGIAPGLDHYTCMVDLLGRANRLDEALETIHRMHLEADKTVWLALLSACQKWRDVKIGKMAFEAVMKLDCREGAAYVFLANTCSCN